MSEFLLKTNGLTKKFKEQAAVDHVNIHVRKGDIYGFIGKNGAGKTTFLKMVSGLSHPTSGEIELFGYTGAELGKVYSRIGTLIEAPGLYPNMTAYENMNLKCLGIGVKDKSCIHEYLTLMGLENVKKKKVKNFSLGMKQRLGIAMAMVGEPDLLLLDEPINGLDPEGIAKIRDILLRLNKEKNMTIIISSHILEELSKIASMYGIINQGHLVQELSKEELMTKCSERIEILSPQTDMICTILEEDFGIADYKVVENDKVYIFEQLRKCSEINRKLANRGIQVNAIGINNESLESYFLGLTGGM
ncbi:MAG: ATP-binding cassette domain-containing protein [bacterium]|nr:ATP-binding cassette domain-containing protein [bacterium]